MAAVQGGQLLGSANPQRRAREGICPLRGGPTPPLARSHSGAQCITCSYKASSGLLYPLERGFIYVHKPPVHIRFDEISFVNFARGTTTTRSFDFEIETKQGTQYTFSSIERWARALGGRPLPWTPGAPGPDLPLSRPAGRSTGSSSTSSMPRS